jgi:NAD(P)-dependent dehydrogenase (short-subunit alcohol dehydrogenase family)
MATVLITGTSRGIGLELARQYAAGGWQVIATARDPEDSEGLDALAEEYGERFESYPLDVTDEESVEELADAMDGRPLDLLINNAGTYPRKGTHIGELDYDAWSETFETNLFGVLRVTEALLENVAQSERKQIAAISSAMGSLRGVIGGNSVEQSGASYQYRTSKTALNMAMAILSRELAPRGISVVTICPGWVKTDMGGPRAAIEPEVSVAGIRKVLAGSPMEITGKFLAYDGSIRPW